MRQTFVAIVLGLVGANAVAGPLPDAIDGWSITKTPYGWQELAERVTLAIEASPINKLSQASATMGAKSIGETIKGNMVIHAYAPQFAVRMLDASIAAGIEAPLRLYITENDDGGATLSYKLPSSVFAAYEDGGEPLKSMAVELDAILAAIAERAAAP